MLTPRAVLIGAAGAPLLALAAAAPAAAHERWFVESRPGGDWGFFLSPLPLALTTVMVVVALAWRYAAFRLPSPELGLLRPLGRLAPYVPRLLAIHLGVSLLSLAATGRFLSHAIETSDVPGGDAAALLEAAIGVWLVTGVRLRAPAVALVALGPLVLASGGAVALLENAALVGIAGFLAVLPPGDGTFGRVEAEQLRLRWALLILRVGVATPLVTLASPRSSPTPPWRTRPWSATRRWTSSWVGIDLSSDAFISVAGSVELLFGLLVLSGALPQVATLVAAVPFNATLLLFGQTELVGHLPVYGVFLTLLAYGSSPVTARAVRWLPTRPDLRVTAAARPRGRGAGTPAADAGSA